MKRNLGLWQITLPLCGLLIIGMGCLTSIYMVNGRYRVDIAVNTKGFRIKTDVDKRECKLIEDKIQHKIEDRMTPSEIEVPVQTEKPLSPQQQDEL